MTAAAAANGATAPSTVSSQLSVSRKRVPAAGKPAAQPGRRLLRVRLGNGLGPDEVSVTVA